MGAEPENFRVSIAIPTRGRPASLARTIESILAGSRLPDEIVVSVQGGRASAALDSERRQWGGNTKIRFHPALGRGAGHNRNQAVAATTGDFLVFCDDDITVDAHWLQRMLSEWRERWSGGLVVITGPILPGHEYEGRQAIPGVRADMRRHVFLHPHPHGDTLYGGHFGAPRAAFERLGPCPFDDRLGPGARYPGADDEDFARRILEAGVPIVYEPSIAVRHHPQPSAWGPMAYRHSMGHGAMLAKELLAGHPGVLLPLGAALSVELGKAGRAAAGRNGREAAQRLLSGVGIAVGFGRWLTEAATERLRRSETPE